MSLNKARALYVFLAVVSAAGGCGGRGAARKGATVLLAEGFIKCSGGGESYAEGTIRFRPEGSASSSPLITPRLVR